MEIKQFEESLLKMSKPDIKQLQHQDMLANAIARAKSKSVVSTWWLSIPLYLLATLLMKTYFMRSTGFFSNLHQLSQTMHYTSLLFFVIVPVVFIIINFVSIRNVYLYSGASGFFSLLKVVWLNALMIVVSLLVLFIYL